MTCEHCNQLLFDYLYDLLDQAEEASLRAHLESCPECAHALAEARASKEVLAQAAQVVREVPAFHIPGQEPKTADLESTANVSQESTAIVAGRPAEATPATTVAPVTLPLPAASARRSPLRRYWPAWSAAAALLITAIGLNGLYQYGLGQRQADVAQAGKKVAEVQSRFAALQADVEKAKKDKAVQLRAAATHLEVIGPKEIRAGVPQNLQVITRDLDGKLQAAQVIAKVLDPQDNKVLFQKETASKGEAICQLPGLDVPDGARVLVEARPDGAQAKVAEVRVEEAQRPASPSHATHLALNKSSYRVGEVVFFRTLTLDRFTLRPPAQSIPLNIHLLDASGKTALQFVAQTGPGGVSGGELPLIPELASGTYSLEVRAADPSANVLPQSRALEIVREPVPEFEFGGAPYRPGEQNANINFRGGPALANQPATVTLRQNNQPIPVAGQPGGSGQPSGGSFGKVPPGAPGPGGPFQNQLQFRLDNAGNLAFQAPIPPNGDKKLEVEVQIHDGKKDARFVQTVPVVPSQKTIQLFPEGGDLVLGVPNKVYYRVVADSEDLAPVEPVGHVILLSYEDPKFEKVKEVVYDSERQKAQGHFTFTPLEKEYYQLRITDGADKVSRIDNPFHAPQPAFAVKREGVVLHVPQSVARAGEPLTLILRNHGKDRRLFLETTCRGQVVDQRLVDLRGEATAVKLQPAATVAGILRVTAFEIGPRERTPIAERLVYRAPVQRLDVGCTLGYGAGPFPVGSKMNMTVWARNEQNQGGPTWWLAAVVDEKHRAEESERGLAAHFFLAGEFGADNDLADANLVLRDGPESGAALDLFLGTRGWRNFVPAKEAVHLAKLGGKDAKGAKKGDKATQARDEKEGDFNDSTRGGVQVAEFFARENATPQALQADYQARLQKEVSETIARARAQRADLLALKEEGFAEMDAARSSLTAFEELPRLYFRIGLGVATLVCLVLGGLFVAIGLVRVLRKSETAPTPAFAGAFCCMFACLVLYLLAGRLHVAEDPPHVRTNVAAGRDRPWSEFAETVRVPHQDEKQLDKQTVVVPPVTTKTVAQAPVDRKKQKADQVFGGMGGRDNESLTAVTRRAEGAPVRVQALQTFDGSEKGAIDPAHEQPREDEAVFSQEVRSRYAALVEEQRSQKGKGGYKVGPIPMSAPGANPASAKVPIAKPPTTPDPRAGVTTEAAKSLSEGKWNFDRIKPLLHERNYAVREADYQDTLLWFPTLYTKDGIDELSFDLSQNLTSYRILIYANTPSGRLGFYEGRLEVRPAAAK